MKTNELRIGNYISFHNVWYKIVGIDKDRVLIEYHNGETDYCWIDYIQPIELTEEVLLKIGFHEGYNKIFIKNTKNDYVKYYITYQHVPDNKYSFVGYGYKNNVQIKCVILNDIKYLHQLQNACFLLTNEELEVEL